MQGRTIPQMWPHVDVYQDGNKVAALAAEKRFLSGAKKRHD